MSEINTLLLLLLAEISIFISIIFKITSTWIRTHQKKIDKAMIETTAIVTGYHAETGSRKRQPIFKLTEINDDKEHICLTDADPKKYPVGSKVKVCYAKTSDSIFGTTIWLKDIKPPNNHTITKVFDMISIIILIIAIVLLLIIAIS